MKYFVFRNNTIEFFFDEKACAFSGYDDISVVPEDADGYIWFYQPPYGVVGEKDTELVRSFAQKFDLVYSRIPTGKEMLAFTLCDRGGTNIVSGDFSFRTAIEEFNTHIIERSRENRTIKVVDFSDFASRYKKSELIDWKYYFTSQLAFSAKRVADFKQWFSGVQRGLALTRKKCIVLDLDGTLWGGVLGEDGIDGIKIGGEYPGKAFLYFQTSLVELSKSGVILAVCSKNNESDVKDCWAKNPYNIITEKYISASRINWNNKADNMREIAAELNIALDSMVFVDDTPTERELVRQALPLVTVPDFPEQPYNLPVFVDELIEKYFKVYVLTDEDRQKTAAYQANVARASEQQKFTDMDSFIKSLALKLTIHRASSMNIRRIAQMTQKTNQFNVTTRRYTENDVNAMLSTGANIWCLSVSDRFGDSGITGCIIVKDGEIDELLLSCRILGKGIEKEFLAQILTRLKAAYIPTAKTAQVKDFYENNGFTLVSEGDGGIKRYTLNLVKYEAKPDDKYHVMMEER